MHVSVHVLTWNDLRYLPDLFASLEAQTYKHFNIRILDNGSTDGTLAYLQEHHSQQLVARNVRNQGFAAGHNQLIRFTLERGGVDDSTKAILLVSADMILHERMLEELVQALQSDAQLGATQPKLFRAFAGATLDDGVERTVRSEVLDTTGLILTKSWRLGERGTGEIDRGQYDKCLDVLGPSGSCALWRVSVLKSLMVDGEVFDSDFFTYAEDGDLALRARRAGWRTLFVPAAHAHHYRDLHEPKRSFWKRLRDHRQRRPMATALSTRNQIFCLLKNITCADCFRSGIRIGISQGVRLVYGLVCEPQTRKLLVKSFPLFFKMFRKRKRVFALARESGKVIRSYVGP